MGRWGWPPVLTVLCVLRITNAQSGWEDLAFSSYGNLEVTYDVNGNCEVKVEEQSTDVAGVLINYSGTTTFTVDIEGDYKISVSNDGDVSFIKFDTTPDYEDSLNKGSVQMTVTDASDTGRDCYVTLVNRDDNPPQIIPKPGSTCSVLENRIEDITSCGFTVSDPDGCAANTIITVTSQGEATTQFSLGFSSPSGSKYPECLQEANQVTTSDAFLKVDQELNYESALNYFLTLTPGDGGGNIGVAGISVIVQVLDAPDQPPVWQTIKSTLTIEEETPLEYTVSAKDGDTGINSAICYRIEIEMDDLDEEEMQYFKINKTSGQLSISPINRDYYQKNSYTLNLIAEECEDVASNVSYPIVIQVQDSINKNLTFSIDGADVAGEYPDQKVDENSIATLEHTVIVYDPDQGNNGTFKAKMDSPLFMVLPTTAFQNGTFTIQGTSLLDYENTLQREIDITLTITENADPTHVLQIPIHISVTDQNDNAPVFQDLQEDNAIHFTVKENVQDGVIGTVRATDVDQNEVIVYGMVSYDGLSVDSSSGEFLVSGTPFDFEQQPKVQIQVTATDNDRVHTTYVSLIIDIEDVNDTPPTIRVQSSGSISVMEDAAEGAMVDVDITASDKDTTALLTAAIDWENTLGYKDNIRVPVERFQGWFSVATNQISPDKTDVAVAVTVIQQLHWDVVDTIQLRVLVTDEHTEESYLSSDSATVTLVITDVNDHEPVFAEDNCGVKGTMQEEAPPNQTIGTVSAKDADGPGNNQIKYSLQEADEKRIIVDSVTGLISTGSQPVDFETEQSIQVVIVAADGDTPNSRSSTCMVTITITDINDEVPMATPDNPSVTILENVRDGHVTFITGQDADKSERFKTLRFSLNSFSNYFSLVDFLNGTAELVAKVGADSSFDFDDGVKQYQLTIVVTDNPDDPTGGKQNSNTTTVTVNIEDVNDNAPIFEGPADETDCLFSASELVGQGITLTGDRKLVANDKDSAENAWVSYAIQSVECDEATMKICPEDKDNMFAVSGNTENVTSGVKADVKSNTLVDRYGVYIVNVTATDHGTRPLTSSKRYRFCVVDENNHSPEFVYPATDAITIRQDENGALVEDTTGKAIPLINTTDADFGGNGDVTLSLTDPSDSLRIQPIGDNQGRLELKVDFSQFLETTVQLQACDTPTSGQQNCVTKPFTVRPRFTSEVEPVFPNTTFAVEFRENSTTESTILPTAEDRNNDNVENDSQLQKIYYFILPGESDVADWFSLDKETRSLTLKKRLDATVQDQYTIMVQASNKPDEGSLPNPSPNSLLNITLTVTDINDKPPVFWSDSYVLSISISDAAKIVLTVAAEDPDRGDTVTYALDPASVDGSHLNPPPADSGKVFSIDRLSGGVKVDEYPSEATTGYLTFVVSATDGVHTSFVDVTVYVVSERFLIAVLFRNSETEVAAHRSEVVDTFRDFFKMTCVPGQIIERDNGTTLDVHFEDSSLKPVEPATLDPIKNDLNATRTLKKILLDNYQLILVQFGDDAVVANEAEGVNTALIVVSAILAALLIAMGIFYFFKTRSLRNLVDRLTNASAPESDKKTFALPNTNQHVDIGSNPVWNTEIARDFDNVSTTSSDDSGLIGIEDNPEFQTFYNDVVLKAKAAKVTAQVDNDILRENPQLRGLGFDNDVAY